jgi:hypothetical protein
MRAKQWVLAVGLALLAASAAEAEITKGTMSVTGAEMK